MPAVLMCEWRKSTGVDTQQPDLGLQSVVRPTTLGLSFVAIGGVSVGLHFRSRPAGGPPSINVQVYIAQWEQSYISCHSLQTSTHTDTEQEVLPSR